MIMLLAPVTNWEPHGVKLAGYWYAMRHGMKVWIVTVYRVSHLQRYGVAVRGNVTSVYSTLGRCHLFTAIRKHSLTSRHKTPLSCPPSPTQC
jgi:hypothetical protein